MLGGRLLKAPRERKTSHLAPEISGQTQASTESEQGGSIGWGCFSVVHPLQFFSSQSRVRGDQAPSWESLLYECSEGHMVCLGPVCQGPAKAPVES